MFYTYDLSVQYVNLSDLFSRLLLIIVGKNLIKESFRQNILVKRLINDYRFTLIRSESMKTY